MSKLINSKRKALVIYLRFVAIIYFIAFLFYLIPSITGWPKVTNAINVLQDPFFAINSCVKAFLVIGIASLAATDVKRFHPLISVFIASFMLSIIPGVLIYLFLVNNYTIEIPGMAPMEVKYGILGAVLFDLLLTSIMIIFYVKYLSEEWQAKYFSGIELNSLEAIAEVVIEGENETISPRQIAKNVDHYFAGFKARQKWISRVILIAMEYYPVFLFQMPLSLKSPELRKKFLVKRFQKGDIKPRFRLLPWNLFAGAVRLAKQLTYMGYYNDPATHKSIGYKTFTERMRDKGIDRNSLLKESPLKVIHGNDFNSEEISVENLIIGSGAGGSVLAKALVEKGQKVFMIERGSHERPVNFNENEIDMISRLLADGALQLSRDFHFQVIQGSAVGGSTVVNNAVSFDTPDPVLNKWNSTEFDAKLNLDDFRNAQKRVKAMIRVAQHDKMSIPENLNPSGHKFMQGCNNLGFKLPEYEFDSVPANINGCLGCGYCNIGCAFGKKMSMLDTVLPDIQKTHGEDALTIVSDCTATKLSGSGGAVSFVDCEVKKLINGKNKNVKLRIKAKRVFVCSGAISSSVLLMKSGIAKGKAGKRLSFNIGSPINAIFPDPINAADGLQISHYLRKYPDPGFILETWFNPPMFQSTAMPGWWDQHFENMKKYNRFAATGILVASENNGEVSPRGLFGRDISFSPTDKDFETLKKGLRLGAEIWLAGGAEAVLLNTLFTYKEHSTLKSLDEALKNLKKSDLGIGSGHPQGGNVMSANNKIGVVDPSGKVHGYNNLYVCDASVFPTSVGVNPQITVMTFAQYIGDRVN